MERDRHTPAVPDYPQFGAQIVTSRTSFREHCKARAVGDKSLSEAERPRRRGARRDIVVDIEQVTLRFRRKDDLMRHASASSGGHHGERGWRPRPGRLE